MSLQGYKLPDDNGGFDLTPMIDVVFLLIVFFMTVASMITEKKELNLAVADEAVVPKEISDRFIFSIDPEGSLYVQNQLIDADEAARRLKQIAATHRHAKLVVRVDRMTEHQYVNQFLGMCADNGISDIIFATYQTDL